MVEIVAPLRAYAVAADLAVADNTRVVQIALGNQHKISAQFGFEPSGFGRQLFQNMGGRNVDIGMDGIEPQTIHVVIPHPHESVIAEKAANLVGAGGIEVDRFAPRGAMPRRVIGAETSEIVAGRAEMVVNHIEDYSQPMR